MKTLHLKQLKAINRGIVVKLLKIVEVFEINFHSVFSR